MQTNINSKYPQAFERAAQVKLMIFDVDGVLTDGRLWIGPNGETMKSFDTLDGHGIKLLAQAGIQTALITGRKSEIVAQRAKDLAIPFVYQGVHDKRVAFADLLEKTQLTAKQAGYMGDDWPDMPVMALCTFVASPAQAHNEIHQRSHYVCQREGGRGAVREVCDVLLKAHGVYQTLLEAPLQAT